MRDPAVFLAVIGLARVLVSQPSALMRLAPHDGVAVWVVFGPVPRALREAIKRSARV